MNRLLMSAALGAMVLASSFATPARATDPLAVYFGVKVLIGASLLVQPGPGLETSVNTQYALTGEGRPTLNNGELAGDPTMKPMAPCHAHNLHCQTMTMAPED
ncbi:MAG: hypothetical protein MK180_13040 [Rhodobacteraceae bacterium]|nr:hypothetical protein [Paracoccaceae bacterium]